MTNQQNHSDGGLMVDLLRLGPAPTMGRELIAATVNLTAVFVLCLLLFQEKLGTGLAIGICTAATVFFVARFVYGTSKWNRRSR